MKYSQKKLQTRPQWLARAGLQWTVIQRLGLDDERSKMYNHIISKQNLSFSRTEDPEKIHLSDSDFILLFSAWIKDFQSFSFVWASDWNIESI